VTTSVIDELIAENRDDKNTTIEEYKKKFNETFNENFIQNLSSEKPELQNNAKNVIIELFRLQDEYYKEFNEEIIVNTRLKQLLVLYNQKYRNQVKKTNRLKEHFESNNIKNTLTLAINREENTRVRDMVNSNKSELKIFRKMMKINYNDSEVSKFKEDNNIVNESEEKRLLLKSIEVVISDSNIFSKLPENKRLAIETICAKYNITLPEAVSDKDNNNYIEEEPIQEENEKKIEEKIENVVVAADSDSLDEQLREFLVLFYLKKNVSQIPFNRLGPGIYQYGTQKIFIKNENDTLKVRAGNKYILLERYIELNANSEEYKIMKFSKKTPVPDSKRASTLAAKGSLTTPPKNKF